MCRSGEERKRRRLAETEIRESTEMAFEVYGEQLKTVPSLKYLGRILTEGGRQLASGGGKPGEATEELGTATADTEQGGGRQVSVGEFF